MDDDVLRRRHRRSPTTGHGPGRQRGRHPDDRVQGRRILRPGAQRDPARRGRRPALGRLRRGRQGAPTSTSSSAAGRASSTSAEPVPARVRGSTYGTGVAHDAGVMRPATTPRCRARSLAVGGVTLLLLPGSLRRPGGRRTADHRDRGRAHRPAGPRRRRPSCARPRWGYQPAHPPADVDVLHGRRHLARRRPARRGAYRARCLVATAAGPRGRAVRRVRGEGPGPARHRPGVDRARHRHRRPGLGHRPPRPAARADRARRAGLGRRDRTGSPHQRPRARPRAPPRPELRTRRDWGADPRWRNGRPHYLDGLKQVHVHHTATGNSYSRDDVPGLIRGMYRYHTQSLGWFDIGYNFLVDRFGRAWVGRSGGPGRLVRGAHTLGFNEDSVGIAMIGTLTSQRPWRPAVGHPDQARRVEARQARARRDRAGVGHVDRERQVPRRPPGPAAGHRRPPRHQRHGLPRPAALRAAPHDPAPDPAAHRRLRLSPLPAGPSRGEVSCCRRWWRRTRRRRPPPWQPPGRPARHRGRRRRPRRPRRPAWPASGPAPADSGPRSTCRCAWSTAASSPTSAAVRGSGSRPVTSTCCSRWRTSRSCPTSAAGQVVCGNRPRIRPCRRSSTPRSTSRSCSRSRAPLPMRLTRSWARAWPVGDGGQRVGEQCVVGRRPPRDQSHLGRRPPGGALRHLDLPVERELDEQRAAEEGLGVPGRGERPLLVIEQEQQQVLGHESLHAPA